MQTRAGQTTKNENDNSNEKQTEKEIRRGHQKELLLLRKCAQAWEVGGLKRLFKTVLVVVVDIFLSSYSMRPSSSLPLLFLVHGRRSEEVAAIRHALASSSASSCERHRRH